MVIPVDVYIPENFQIQTALLTIYCYATSFMYYPHEYYIGRLISNSGTNQWLTSIEQLGKSVTATVVNTSYNFSYSQNDSVMVRYNSTSQRHEIFSPIGDMGVIQNISGNNYTVHVLIQLLIQLFVPNESLLIHLFLETIVM